MSLAIFAVGIVVFLITVYGTVVGGGLLLTGQQLDDHPHLVPESAELDGLDGAAVRARAIIDTEF